MNIMNSAGRGLSWRMSRTWGDNDFHVVYAMFEVLPVQPLGKVHLIAGNLEQKLKEMHSETYEMHKIIYRMCVCEAIRLGKNFGDQACLFWRDCSMMI